MQEQIDTRPIRVPDESPQLVEVVTEGTQDDSTS